MLQVVCCISLMLHLLPCTALLMLFCLGAMCKLCLQQLLSLQSPALRICAGRIYFTARLPASPPERPVMQVPVQCLLCRPFRCCSSRFCCCTSAHYRICCYIQKDSHLKLPPIGYNGSAAKCRFFVFPCWLWLCSARSAYKTKKASPLRTDLFFYLI